MADYPTNLHDTPENRFNISDVHFAVTFRRFNFSKFLPFLSNLETLKFSYIRRSFFFIGWFFCAAAVIVVRYDHLLHFSTLFSPNLNSFVSHLLSQPWFVGLPPSMVPGLLLLFLGWVFLLTSPAPSAGSHQNVTTIPEKPPFWRELRIPALVTLVSLSLFFIAEKHELLAKNYMLLPFAGLLVASCLYLGRLDRRQRIRLAPHFSALEVTGLVIAFFSLLCVYAAGLNSWKYSFIGDEFMFYWDAQKLAHGGLSSVPWLEASGSWDYFPMALDGYQAAFLKLFGDSNFSWRFSMSVLVALCLPALYLSLRHLCGRISKFPRSCAAFGCAVFFLSEFVIIWARIGKPHAGFLPPVVIAPMFYFAARTRNSRLYYFLTGVACGCGFFVTSLGVLVAISIVGTWLVIDLLLAFFRARESVGEIFSKTVFVALGFLTASAPFLVQIDHYLNIYGVAITSTEAARNAHLRWAKTFQSFFIFLYYRANGHFLAANVVNPIVAIFVAAGLGIGKFVRWRSWVDAGAALVVISFLVGGMSQYPTPPVTRMHLIMYPFSIFAALSFGVFTMRWRGSFTAVFATILVLFTGFYSMAKISYFNPYWRAVPTQMIEMRRIEAAASDRVFLYFYGNPGEGYLLKSMADSRGLQRRVQFFSENPEGLADLEEALGRYGGNAEVVFSDSVRDVARLRGLCEKNGVPSTELSLNQRPPPDERAMGRLGTKMFHVFSFLERDRQG